MAARSTLRELVRIWLSFTVAEEINSCVGIRPFVRTSSIAGGEDDISSFKPPFIWFTAPFKNKTAIKVHETGKLKFPENNPLRLSKEIVE